MNNFNSKSPFDFYRNRFTIIGIAISGLLGLLNTNAQNPNTIFKNTTQTGNAPNIACKSVHLAAGYKYTAQTGFSMQASVNPYLGCDVDYGTGYSPLTIPQLNTSYEVGTTPGSFDVSQSGAATYSIPLTAPPGTMGMAPKLSINYNSQGGNGLMGIGWSLGGFGLSSITRTSQNYYFEGQTYPVSLNSNDRFLLDGSRLMPTSTGTYGDIGMTYGTESETFVKVTSIGGTAGNPAWFKVETKEGYTLEYGNTTNSFINAGATTTAISWLLNKIIDRDGNYMTISYFENNGEFYPDRIDYTGNASPTLTPYNYVKFVYDGNRTDKQVIYIAGYPVKQNVLLTSVEMWAQGTFAHSYEFSYAYTVGASCVTEVTERGQDKKQYNPVRFVYGEETSGISGPYAAITQATSLANYVGTFLPLDYNGDGHTDILQIADNNRTWALYKNDWVSNQQTFTSVATGTMPIDNYLKPALNQPNMVNLDLDGDGDEDMLVYTGTATNILGQEVNDASYIPYFSNGTTLVQSGAVLSFPGKSKYLLGDFDGDGATDLFVHYYETNTWRFYSFKRNVVRSNVNDIGKENLVFYAVDYDGDGKHEILLKNKTSSLPVGYTYLLNLNVTGSNNILSAILPIQGYPNYFHSIYPGDFNGDGKTDLLTYDNYSTATGWKIAYRSGTELIQTTAPFSETGKDIFVYDFNADGRQDILVKGVSQGVFNWPSLKICFSNGAAFDVHTLSPDLPCNCTMPDLNIGLLGDFDGDGYQDFMYKDGSIANKARSYIVTFMSYSRSINKLTQVNNGLDLKTTIEYITLPRLSRLYNEYTKGSGSTFPVIDFQQAINVVRSYTSSNGIGAGVNNIKYTYSGAKVHLQGKGFLGFTGTTVTDAVKQLKTVNTFDLPASANFFQTTLQESKTSTTALTSNNIISDKIYTYSHTALTNSRYYTYLSNLSDNDNLHGVLTMNTYTQNAFGNPTQTTSVNSAVTVSTSTNYEAKTPSGSTWPVYALLNSTSTITRSGQPAINKTTTYTNNAVGKPLTITENGVVTTLAYGTYGSLSSSTTSGSDFTTRSKTNTYDPLVRFVKNETNALGHIIERTYDNAYGNILTEKDANQLMSLYKYDGFGRLIHATTPTGQQINIARAWSNGAGPANSLYQITKTQASTATTNEFYDLFGRTLRTQTTGFDGTNINTDIVYNSLGQLYTKSEPYYQVGGTLQNNTFTYDEFLREKTITSASGAVVTNNYTYGSSTINITNTGPGQKNVTKTFDASGALTSVTDAGGTLTYTYNSIGKPLTISIPGTTAQIVMTYDSKGNQLTLNDPDAGLTTYTYNGLNEILTQTDAKGNIHTMTYDALGRMLTKTGNNGEGLISYTYDNKTKGIGMLGTVTGLGITQDYAYDDYSRLLSQSENINGTNYVTSMLYDNLNRVTKTTYPSGFATTSEYNTNGYLNKINRASDNSLIWQCNTVSERGQVKTTAQGNGGSVSKTYSNLGYLQNISAMEKNGGGTPVSVINDGYSFNPITGNLNSRSKNLPGPTWVEDFTPYDNSDRLTSVKLNGTQTLGLGYEPNGNIQLKTDAGGYRYYTNKPHAVGSIENPSSAIPTVPQNITYNTFLKPATIAEGTYNLTYTYGPDYERKKSVLQNNGTTQQTIIYSGNYEKITVGANTYEVHYINSPDGLIAMNVRTNGVDALYYVHTDHLGSITSIYDANGTKVFEQSFDAWGRPRNPANWTYTASGLTQPAWLIRGYTGHEYLPQFNLVNMNARLYDPLVGRVLSPDNFVQESTNSQNYNRYSYCLNNPLIFTDPTGHNFWHWAFGQNSVAYHLGAYTWNSILGITIAGAYFTTFVGTVASSTIIGAVTGYIVGGDIGAGIGAVTGFGTGLVIFKNVVHPWASGLASYAWDHASLPVTPFPWKLF